MFIVYSPEGQSFIGVPPPKPELKVDGVHPVRAIDENPEEEKSSPQTHPHPHSNPSISAYETVKETTAKQVLIFVREIMSSPVITLDISADLNQAWQTMQKSHVHALPILKEGLLTGLITESEVIFYCLNQPNARVEDLLNESVTVCMQKQVITTLPQTEIRRVAMVMHQYKVHALPVMSEMGELEGMITRSDLIERLAEPPPLELYV